MKRSVTATAYGNDGVSVSATTWFRVWRASNYISIVKMSGPSDVVVGKSFTVSLETNAGFDRVKWYLKEVRAVIGDEKNYGDPVDTSYGPHYRASTSHTFGNRDGSKLENGKAYRITAKAYDIRNPSGTPVMTDIEQIIINVHEGKKTSRLRAIRSSLLFTLIRRHGFAPSIGRTGSHTTTRSKAPRRACTHGQSCLKCLKTTMTTNKRWPRFVPATKKTGSIGCLILF